jgi:glycosyltransferase involved in cell wall biosynthesis
VLRSLNSFTSHMTFDTFDPMKILVLTDVLFPDTTGGAGRVAFHIGLELGKMGHEVHFLTRNPGGKLLQHEHLNPNLSIHRFHCPPSESFGLFFHEVKNSYCMARDLSREIGFDSICIHQCMAAVGPLFVGSLKNRPIYYFFHSPWNEEYLIKKLKSTHRRNHQAEFIAFLMKRIEKHMISKASKLLVLSGYMRNRLTDLHRCPSDKIVQISGGVDIGQFHLPDGGRRSVKIHLNLPKDKTVFLTVRNLVPRMGLESLIEAFNGSDSLREKGFLLMGGKGFLEGRLKELVFDFDLEDTIHFLGFIPDEKLPGFYQAADYFVLPTKELEGFGLVILEAMACGTPVLGTPVGAIPEVIGPFDNRLIFTGTSPEDLRKKMEEIIERPAEYHFEPSFCRKFVEERYAWEKVADDFEKVATLKTLMKTQD